MKKILSTFFAFSALVVLMTLSASPSSLAQQASTTASISCIPVQQTSQQKTQLECRMRSSETPYFLVSEIGFPFNVTNVTKVSSVYSATIGMSYPAEVVENTVFIASVGWGDSTVDPRVQAIPFDSLSILLETDQSMSEVKNLLASSQITVSLLTPNPANPLQPFFQTLPVEDSILFDGTLILESFARYNTPGVLEFLRLGLACYEQTAQACLANVIQNL